MPPGARVRSAELTLSGDFTEIGPNGDHVFSKSFTNRTIAAARTIAADADDNIVIGGFSYMLPLDFGGGHVVDVYLADFAAKLDPMGNALWAKAFGEEMPMQIESAATDGDGNAYFTGWFVRSMDFGDVEIHSDWVKTFFLAKLDAAGAISWARKSTPLDDPERMPTSGGSVAVGEDGAPFVSGYLQGTSDFDSEALASAGGSDVLLLKVAP